MEDDRELDKLVAEKVMGWVDFWTDGIFVMGYPPNEQAMGINAERAPVPHYSTDISAAWAAVEKMRGREYQFSLHANVFTMPTYHVAFSHVEGTHGYRAESDTPALAICLAALRACGVEVEQ
jgi:hypothetical protein